MSGLPEHYLTRGQALALLRQYGFPIARSTLDKLCMPSTGYKGPKVAGVWPDGRVGAIGRPLYRAKDVLAWAQARLKPAPDHTL
jgi:hypothetical protein